MPEAVRHLKEASGSDLSIGGAAIAAEAFRHGLVDECVLLRAPCSWEAASRRCHGVYDDLDLLDLRRFSNGVIYLRHAVRSAT